jgi:hypothetical protein
MCSLVYDTFFLKHILPETKLERISMFVKISLPGFIIMWVGEKCITCKKYRGLQTSAAENVVWLKS